MKQTDMILKDWIRFPFLLWYYVSGRLQALIERLEHCEIGTTGYISDLNRRVALERKLKPINWFDRWVLKLVIQAEQEHRRSCFRQACIDVTGEDPDTDW